MAPSKSRMPDSGDTSHADTPMADGNEDTVNQQHGGNLDDSMAVSAQTREMGCSQCLPYWTVLVPESFTD